MTSIFVYASFRGFTGGLVSGNVVSALNSAIREDETPHPLNRHTCTIVRAVVSETEGMRTDLYATKADCCVFPAKKIRWFGKCAIV